MLRTASAEAIAAHDPLGMASFPLVPYSNRIADARFGWAGQTHADVDHAVVYTPAGAPHFCIEPVAHLPNALSVRVAPGESHRATMRLIAQAASFGA
jgi:galactose mutarotase-like enzyme